MLSQDEESKKKNSFYTARKTSPIFFTLVYMVSSSNAYILQISCSQQQKFAEYDGLIS
jgi:hypothetical protein